MTSALLASVIGVTTLSYARWFYRKQNQGHIVGGPISVPKALWLAYAVNSWFLIPFIFLVAADLNPALRNILIVHLASWWLRGPIELYMIYKSLNWSPIYGISHDVAHIFMILGLAMTNWNLVSANRELFSINGLAQLYLVVTLLALVMEIVFADLFRKTRGFEKGADLIYFASTDPIYRTINRLTLTTVIVVYAHFVFQLIALYTIAISKSGG